MAEEGGLNEETVKAITKRINGGYNGIDDRLMRMERFRNQLKEDPQNF
jgi:predicted chitinase